MYFDAAINTEDFGTGSPDASMDVLLADITTCTEFSPGS